MVAVVFVARLALGQEALDVGIRDMQVLSMGGQTCLYAVSGQGGGLVSYSLQEGIPAQLTDQRHFANSWGPSLSGQGILVDTDRGPKLVLGSDSSGDILGISLSSDGALQSRGSFGELPDLGRAFRDMVQDAAGRLWVIDAQGSALRGYLSDGQGGYRAVFQTSSAPEGLSLLCRVESRAGQFLIAAETGENSLVSYAVSPDRDSLEWRDSMGAANGLGMMTPVALETVTLAGTAYVVVASAAGGAGALSVLRLCEDGSLLPVDHVLDTRETRFGQVQSLSVVPVGDRAYVVAGGGDDGLSLFVLGAGGRLVHVQALADTVATGLANVAVVEAARVGEALQIFVAAQAEQGVSQFAVSLANQGLDLIGPAGGGALAGRAGDDLLIGGSGNDRLEGGGGQDIIEDGLGVDTISGGPGADIFVLRADGQFDRITDFEPGVDRLDLSDFPMLYGPEQLTITSRSYGALIQYRDETLEVRRLNGGRLDTADLFAGGWGAADRPLLRHDYQIIGTERGDALYGQWGDDSIQGLGGDDIIRAGDGRDLLDGGDGDDQISGEGGDDLIEGGANYDLLLGGGGQDTIRGGNGRDTIWAGDGDDLFQDSAQTGDHAGDLVHGQGGADSLMGGGGADTLWGGAGADVLAGGSEGDRLQGGAGADALYGGDGFDVLHGEDGDDEIWGGNGRDYATLGMGDDLFMDNAQGGDWGRDTVHGNEGNDTIQGGNGRDVFDGGAGNDLVIGRADNDILTGAAGQDTLDGGDGDDTVWAGTGPDLVFLGRGDDLFQDSFETGVMGQDIVYGGDGTDTIQGGGGDDRFFGMGGEDRIFGREGNDLLMGGNYADTLDGGDGRDTIWGGNGPDLVFMGWGDDIFHDNGQGGMSGRDTVYGGAGNDTFEGGEGNDVFFGMSGADLLRGRGGDDVLYAGEGADTVLGGAGADQLWGSSGDDWLSGDAGGDVFVFEPWGGTDRITDFAPGEDRLRFLGTGLDWTQLQLSQAGADTLIEYGTGTVLLEGTLLGALDMQDFLFA